MKLYGLLFSDSGHLYKITSNEDEAITFLKTFSPTEVLVLEGKTAVIATDKVGEYLETK